MQRHRLAVPTRHVLRTLPGVRTRAPPPRLGPMPTTWWPCVSRAPTGWRGMTSDTLGPPKAHPVWRLGKLNHVAIATPNLDAQVHFYRTVLGSDKVSEKRDLPSHGVTTVFIELGETKLELLAPFGPASPIEGFLRKAPVGGLHHICIEVDNLDKAVESIQAHGIRTLTKAPVIGAHNLPVIFLHPKDCAGVLVELEQCAP